jgi:hypothetical protein
MKKKVFAAAICCSLAASSVCHAQSVEQMVQATINAKGKDCPRVTAVKPLGTTDTGTPLIAAACSNGERHVLKILPNNTLDYLSSCAVFESFSKAKCF